MENINLDRFIAAQENIYKQALTELRNGNKRSHWIWFIFPQIQGLGRSSTAQFYSIKNKEEAKAYLKDPILGNRLKECCQAILEVEGKSATEILGFLDALKLKSSMTLFDSISDDNSTFRQVLQKYYNGEVDDKTLKLLK